MAAIEIQKRIGKPGIFGGRDPSAARDLRCSTSSGGTHVVEPLSIVGGQLAVRGECFEKLREADTEIDSAYLVTAQRVLELAKHARTHWDRRSPQQKRELLAEVVCNSRLDGRTLRYDLQKPFDVLAKMRAANDWCPQGDSNPR